MMTFDVVIVGGGPNGLLLGCELSLAGVHAVVLERLPERSPVPKANGLVGRVVQALDYRGLYERLAGHDGPPEPMPFYQFSGLPLDLRGLDANPMYALQIPQTRIEQVLEERARDLGVEIRRGHELTALEQDEDAVTIEVHGPEGDHRLRTQYLVGADGGHSLVRKLAGIAFPGITDETFVSRIGHAVLPDSVLAPGTGELHVPGTGLCLRPYAHNRLPGGVFTFAMMQPQSGAHLVAVFEWDRPPVADSTPMTFEELREGVRRVLGADLPISQPSTPGPHLLRRLTGINSRQADSYRAGRVLLLGDAAHVHSAVGGPGLNLGMQDAINLGWKLAAEVRGWAPSGLLDTYESERAPASRRVLMQTRAQMALMRPGEDITATRELLSELLDDDGNRRRIADLMAGTDIRYDMGDDASPPHPLVGRWVPDFHLGPGGGPTRIARLMRPARPLLLNFSADPTVAHAAKGWQDRVDVIAVQPMRQPAPAAALLIRPDGYVAWAEHLHQAEQPVRHGLHEALTTWFGAANQGM
jgi:2-polyprenyl-6-methoxyphenol hydroxylase-like FAD-dependent oxidoreductase